MNQRLMTALTVGLIAAAVGVGISFYLKRPENMLGIALATGLVGFFLGLAFKFRVS
jgi:hypothetical protein